MRNLQQALPAVCEALTGRRGIKIVWCGPARTDGRTIWSDPLPLDADEDTRKTVVGNVDHESGHILYSDFDLLHEETPEPLKKALWNAIEDTMVERRMGERYIGCRQTLAESAELIVAQGKARTGEDGPADALTTFVDAWGRVNVNRQKVEAILASSRSALEGHLGPAAVKGVEAVLQGKLAAMNTSRDALEVTEELLALLGDMADGQAEESGSDGQGDGEEDRSKDDAGEDDQGAGSNGQGQTAQDNTEDGRQGEDGNNGAQDDPGPQDTARGQQEADTRGQDDGQDNQTQAHGGEKDGQDDATGEEDADGREENGSSRAYGQKAEEGAKAILQDETELDAVIDREQAMEEVAERTRMEMEWTPPTDPLMKPESTDERRYREAMQGLAPEIAKLQRRISSLFQTETRKRWVTSEDEGRLDSRRLHRAFVGDRRVRRCKVKTTLPKPVVQILLDCSGSMVDERMELARQASIAVLETCERLTIPNELIGFGVENACANHVALVKNAETPLKRAAAFIGGLYSAGGTPIAEAMWLGGRRLVQRREARKIMILVTDGEANKMEAAGEIAERVVNSGIELYGIGIMDNTVEQYCPNSTVLVDQAGIADAMLGALRKGIFGR